MNGTIMVPMLYTKTVELKPSYLKILFKGPSYSKSTDNDESWRGLISDPVRSEFWENKSCL